MWGTAMSERSTDPVLGVDVDIDGLLGMPPDYVARAAADDARLRYGLARRLQIERRRHARAVEEYAAVSAEWEQHLSTLSRRLADLEAMFEDMARTHRAAGLGNTLVIPGVGEWSTRKRPARWEVDNEGVLAQLDPESPLVERPEPVQPPPKLRGREFRAYLTETLQKATAGRGDMPPEELADLARTLAEQWGDAVRYVPESIGVEFHAREDE